MRETRKRSLVKAVLWRIVSFSGTAFILWLFGETEFESLLEAFTISAGAIAIYYVYERVWQRINWGLEK